MSTPFTINASNWHEKAEELRLAYSERNSVYKSGFLKFAWRVTDEETGAGIWEWQTGAENEAGGDSEDNRIVGGENLQAKSFWAGMQGFVEGAAGSVVDLGYLPGQADDIGYGGDVPGVAFMEFCRAVGSPLFVSEEDYGWPRSVALGEDGEPVMTRGRFEEGDYITPRLIESLVAAFNHMRYFALFVQATNVVGINKVSHFWATLITMTGTITSPLVPPLALGSYIIHIPGPTFHADHIEGTFGLTEILKSSPFAVDWYDWYRPLDYYNDTKGDWVLGSQRGLEATFSIEESYPPDPPLAGNYYTTKKDYEVCLSLDFTNGPAE